MRYLLSVGLFITGLLFANQAYAYSAFVDTFESYTNGTTVYSNNNDYTNSASITVTNSGCYGGTGKCMSIAQGVNMKYYPDGTASNQYLSFKIKVGGATDIRLWYGNGGTDNLIRCNVTASSTMTCIYSANGTSQDTVLVDADFSFNTWHAILFQYLPSNNTYRIRIDNEAWSPYMDPYYGDINYEVKQIYITPTVGTTYIDNIDNSNVYIDNIVQSWSDYMGLDLSAEIQTVQSQSCFIGQECRLYFSFNTNAIGDNVYLLNNSVGEEDIASAIASTTIADNADKETYIIVPAVASSTTNKYFLYLDHLNGTTLKCGIEIRWISDSEFLAFFGEYDINEACADVATSSGSTMDDWRYAIECGYNKTLYWASHPSTEVIQNVSTAYNDMTKGFPLNIMALIFDSMNKETQQASTTTFVVPLYVGEFGGSTSTINVLTPTTLTSVFGNMWPTIYELMQTIVYFMTFFYFINWFITKHD